jgi:hypothetical protein
VVDDVVDQVLEEAGERFLVGPGRPRVVDLQGRLRGVE